MVGPFRVSLFVQVLHVFNKVLRMFTFHKSRDKQEPLFFIGEKAVYTQFKKEDKIRIPPFRDAKNYLISEEFRERYGLSRNEAKELKSSIHSDIVPETKLKTKFYEIRRDLNQRLYNEIDLRGSESEIHWQFPKDITQWPTSILTIGSSGVGKTWLVRSWIEEALKRKKKRSFIYISPEFEIDATLKKLRNNKRWQKHFTGIDVSDKAFRDASQGTPEAWWDEVIWPVIDNATPGTCVVLDDSPDAVVYRQLQKFLIKYLRTGRHRKVGVVSLQHSVRGGKWTSQAFSSVKTVVLFPRGGGKGKIIDFLTETVGVTRKKANQLCELFAESGRWMAIHSWSPVVLYGSKYAIWV